MLGDTIFAVASPPGAAARGILRISGPDAIPTAARLLTTGLPRTRAAHDLAVTILDQPVPCLVLVMPAPRSYTGEDVVELHLPGAPLLLQEVAGALRSHARDAAPGEFTRRAYQHGRLDLSAAEGVLSLIEADGAASRRQALALVRGDLAAAVDGIRARLGVALALLEAGLDFPEDETGSVAAAAWLPALVGCVGELERLHREVPRTEPGGDWLLLGAVNAGKSSLCNALVGAGVSLVSALPGTTRDCRAWSIGDGLRLLDAPGDLVGAAGIEADALALRDRIASGCAGVVLVVDATDPQLPATGLPVLATVITKIDRAPRPLVELPAPVFAVSARRGDGVAALRAFLERRGGGPAGGGHRLADALQRAGRAVEAGVEAARARYPEELIAEELRGALVALDEVDGRGGRGAEDLLDRIFAGFCLGK